MAEENRIVSNLDDVFNDAVDDEVVCTGNHPPCNCGWRQIARKLGYKNTQQTQVLVEWRKRQRAKEHQMAYRRYQKPEEEPQDLESVHEKLDEVREMMIRSRRRYVSAPPRPTEPQPQPRTGKGGIALP